MSLEEFPPNNEFLGRNFNAGEVIQLVLKDKQGRWLGFKFVQMVMMHELAHCKQMNHSKFFWQVRNGFASEMEGLWAKKYVGEGMWGRGKDLTTGAFVQERELAEGDVPEHLCGGTYRRKGRKRKRGGQAGDRGADKPKLTYAERQQKRIAKKFGVHGEGAALGDDEMIRGALESASGKRHAGKPRVANSKRGRELRAQAALARFGAAKSESVKEEPEVKPEPFIKQEPENSETDSDWDDAEFDGSQSDGETDMIKVCGDEGEHEDGAHNEMDELRKMGQKPPAEIGGIAPKNSRLEASAARTTETPAQGGTNPAEDHVDSETESKTEDAVTTTGQPSESTTLAETNALPQVTSPAHPNDGIEDNHQTAEPTSADQPGTCPICSLVNDPSSPTCVACSNVLQPSLMPDHWRCKSEACQGGSYINAGDAGRCGICGAQKPKQGGFGGGRPVGVIGSDVLRWD